MTLLLLVGGGLAHGGSLARRVEEVLDDPALDGATAAVVVADAETGEVLVSLEADALVLPASTLKWATAIGAAEVLGLDWRFQTRLGVAGSVREGVLDGDVVITGSGDPSLGMGDARALMDRWVAAVRARGITRVTGDVVADASGVADPYLGSGWAWDDVPYGYSAPVAGLNLRGNLFDLTVSGDQPTRVGGGALQACVDVHSVVTAGSPSRVRLHREPWRPAWLLTGTVPVGRSATVQTPLPDPPRCAALALRAALSEAGVQVEGAARVGAAEPGETLDRIDSPPLSELLTTMLKRSDNLIAEAVARAMDREHPHTFRGAREELVRVLERAGLDAGGQRIADGSGLSRYNLVTARFLVELTRHAWVSPAHAPLRDMLPVAGVDGTLAPRLAGTPAAGTVQAKTGSMTGVRNIVGFATDSEGRELVFAMLFVSFLAPQADVIAAQDRAITLVAVSRRGRVRGRDARAILAR